MTERERDTGPPGVKTQQKEREHNKQREGEREEGDGGEKRESKATNRPLRTNVRSSLVSAARGGVKEITSR